jgi:hypothetical protein
MSVCGPLLTQRRPTTPPATGASHSLDISKPSPLIRENPLLPKCPCADVTGSGSRNTSLSSNILLTSGLESNRKGDTEQNVSWAKDGVVSPANLGFSASFRYSLTMNLAIRRPALSRNTVVRSNGVSRSMKRLLEGAWEVILVAAREDLEEWSCGERSPRQRRPDAKGWRLAFNGLRRGVESDSCSGSAARGRQGQQSRAMRCCGSSGDEAGLEVGSRSNSVPLHSVERQPDPFESGLRKFARVVWSKNTSDLALPP